MSQFSYALAFNLTFMQEADPALLKKMHMDPKRCKEMVTEPYHIQQKSLGHNTAEYAYSWKDNGKRKIHTNLFSYDPSVNALPLNEILILAAHEMKHCERRGMMGRDKSAPLIASVLGGTVGTFVGLAIMPSTETAAGLAIASTSLSYMVGSRLKNAATFNEEVHAYRHMEIMAHVLGTPTRYLQNNDDTIDAKTRSFSGENYPNSDTINQIKFEAQEICAKNKIPVFTHKQMTYLHDQTYQNLKNDTLRFIY